MPATSKPNELPEHIGDSDRRQIEEIEVGLLLDAIFQRYGYDFRQYAKASLYRRIRHRLEAERMETVSDLLKSVLYDKAAFQRLLFDFSVTVTEMFRDPGFFLALRRQVIPILRTYPHIKIWHAGCSTGEEAYSMAILLKEEGLYDRTLIYATDINETVLQKAREGVYPAERVRDYTANYQRANGAESFAEYYTAHYGLVSLDQGLRKNIVFATHNLVADNVFGEMHMVVCRNVMIYFNRQLQNRAIKLFTESLCPRGFLCIGPKESLQFTEAADLYEEFHPKERVYRRR